MEFQTLGAAARKEREPKVKKVSARDLQEVRRKDELRTLNLRINEQKPQLDSTWWSDSHSAACWYQIELVAKNSSEYTLCPEKSNPPVYFFITQANDVGL